MVRAIILAVGFGMAGGAMAAPVAVPTNLPSAVTYAAPAAGFDVVHASDAELDAYGFAPRPPAAADARSRRVWEQIAAHSRSRVMPVLEQTALAAGPPRSRGRGLAGNATSINWSGEVILNNANGLGPGAFQLAATTFNIPIASQPFNTCDGGTDRLFTWVGIDGWSLDQVFQAGTESDATCVAGSSLTFYSAWYEWYPYFAVRVQNLPVVPGDVMSLLIWATSPTTGNAWIANDTTNTYVIIGFSAPAGVTLKGDSVEWIQERPTWNGVRANLTNYVTAWMSGAAAAQYGSFHLYDFASPPAGAQVFGVTMLDNAGGAISAALPAGNNALVFNTSGSAR